MRQPSADRPAPPILRPRVLRLLGERFERRVCTIEAGAGFGKTTVLHQAIEQNRLQPVGLDLLFSCRPSDRFEESLAERLRALVDPSDEREVSVVMRDFVWRHSPQPVAVVLDDAHELRPHSSGLRLVEEILRELPTNGHLVLCGRAPLGLARGMLRSRDDILELGETDLAFDTDERARFMHERGASDRIVEDGVDWPALLELRVRSGRAEFVDSLLDEALADLDPDAQEALAALARFDTLDDTTVALLTRSRRSARELTASLPLMRPLDDGSISVHALWRPALSRLPGADDRRAIAAAAQRLREQGETEKALELLAEIGDEDAIRALLRDLIRGRSPLLGTEALQSILAQIPPSLRDSREGILIDGLTTLRSDAERALPLLERAAALAVDAGDTEVEIRALVAQGHVAYYKGEVGRLFELGAYGRDLAERGVDEARPLSLVADACGALVEMDPERALALVDRARSIATVEGVPDFMIAALASLDAGQPERASAELERARHAASPNEQNGALEVTGLCARWQAGQTTPEDLERIRPSLTIDAHDSAHNLAVHLGLLTHHAASFGDVDSARAFEAECRSYLDRSFDGRAIRTLTMGRTALAILEGDEARAARILEDGCGPATYATRPGRHALRGLAFSYLLLPESRDPIDALALPSAWALGRDLGRSLVALREEDDTKPAAELDWQRMDRFLMFLVPPLLTELAVAAGMRGVHAPIDPNAVRSDARTWLRRMAENQSGNVGSEARRLLTQIPIPPQARVALQVLGPLELRRNGALVDDADWRRSRVRALLLYLVLHPGAHRDEVGVALWPDNPTRSVANNLRVNLHHLMRVLQPERERNESSWFVRQQDDRLWLAQDDFLAIDLQNFDARCRAGWAAQAEGSVALALDHFMAATDCYGGDFCSEATELWAAPERARLRNTYLRTAQRAGELLVAKGDPEPVRRLADQMLATDPFLQSAHRLQGHALILDGDRDGARRALREAFVLLADEGLPLEDETRSLAERLALEMPRAEEGGV